ncbi:hypothetical protein DPMN_096280 [Dreissena polymorpha]|uniref:Uncharacterized protein n=1 Tax=Dreissena polymorpha TaxID=45954 RepID=A0A9D4L8F5_DREPO|nr:hypothetical protein DPMN_096280 [Dreissena polymorpha]
MMGISLLRVPQSKTGELNTAVYSSTSFNQTPVSFRIVPDQKRTMEVRPYLRQR